MTKETMNERMNEKKEIRNLKKEEWIKGINE